MDQPSTIDHEQSNPLLNDFERSPLRFELEVLLEEYKTLRAEIEQRLTNEQQIISFAIGLIVAAITLSQFLPSLGDPSLRPAYLIVSMVFSAFALMNIEHDAMMASIGTYIETRLRPRIEEILAMVSEKNLRAFEWDAFRAQLQFRQPNNAPFFYLMAASRYAITIGPSVAFIIIYWWNAETVIQKPIWETMLFAFAAFLVACVFASAVFAGRLYIILPEQSKTRNESENAPIRFFAQRKGRLVVLIFLIVLYGFIGFAIATRQIYASRFAQVDFNTYYAAAKLLSQGKDIYDAGLTRDVVTSFKLECINGSNYIYAPYLAFALSPVAFLHPLVLGLL
ncbi:hypothetical protein MUP77_19255, partial [Candidatus Bathyarchaeota archaeon]|nr:hypothetical protein [Candidatus Bathyarchaeota archaeon]